MYILARETFGLKPDPNEPHTADRGIIKNAPHYAELVLDNDVAQYCGIGNAETDVKLTFSKTALCYRASLYVPSTRLEKFTLTERVDDYTWADLNTAVALKLEAQRLCDLDLYRAERITYPVDVPISEEELEQLSSAFFLRYFGPAKKVISPAVSVR
jgi:hypothetical protein